MVSPIKLINTATPVLRSGVVEKADGSSHTLTADEQHQLQQGVNALARVVPTLNGAPGYVKIGIDLPPNQVAPAVTLEYAAYESGGRHGTYHYPDINGAPYYQEGDAFHTKIASSVELIADEFQPRPPVQPKGPHTLVSLTAKGVTKKILAPSGDYLLRRLEQS
jgi:hypothetical protein